MLKHIQTAADYREYERRVKAFFRDEGLNCLTPEGEEFFSSRPCEVCRRPLGGGRYSCRGYIPETRDVEEYEVCVDCVYYSEYGQLDDTTMMEIDDAEAEQNG